MEAAARLAFAKGTVALVVLLGRKMITLCIHPRGSLSIVKLCGSRARRIEEILTARLLMVASSDESKNSLEELWNERLQPDPSELDQKMPGEGERDEEKRGKMNETTGSAKKEKSEKAW